MRGSEEQSTHEQMNPNADRWRHWQPSLAVVAVGLTFAVLARSLLSVWTIQQGFIEYNADGFTRIIRGWEWLQAPRWEVEVWLPLHFWFYGGILAVWENIYLAPRVVNFGLGIVTILLLYGIGSRLIDRRAGLIAAAIGALFPYEVWLSLSGMSEPLFHVLIVFAAFGLASWWTGNQPWLLVCAGVALAAATAVRYEGWFYAATFVPLVIAATWYLRRDWRYPVLASILAVTFMGVWMQQNHAEFSDPFHFVRATEEIRFLEDPENIEAGFVDRVTFFPQRAIEVAPLLLPAGLLALGLMLYQRPLRWAGLGILVGIQALLFIGMTAPFASLGPGGERFLLSNILLLTIPLGAAISYGIDRWSLHGIAVGAVVLLAITASLVPSWLSPPLDYPDQDTRDLARHIGSELDRSPDGIAVVLLPEMPDERFNEGYAFRVLSDHPGRVEITDLPARLYEGVQLGQAVVWVMDERIDAEEPPAIERAEAGGYIMGSPPPPASATLSEGTAERVDSVLVVGSDFLSDEAIATWWTSPAGDTYAGPDLQADEDGELGESEIELPSGAEEGTWALTLAGQESLRQAFVEVEVSR